MQCPLQFLQLLMPLRLHGWVVLWSGFHLVDEYADLDSFGHRRAAQDVLMQYVKCDREQIRLRTADRLEVVDAQKAQEDLLDEIGNVSQPVPEPRRKEASQPLPVLLFDVGNECLLVALLQSIPPKTVP